tara:strand:- start:1421 stop:2230 length:810 start_codon:yes stop_codon:yes gene_type:complete
MRSNLTKILGACCRIGQPKLGVEKASLNLKNVLNHEIEEIHNFDDEGNGYFDLYSKVALNMELYERVITIGGDHSIALSTCSAVNEYYNIRREKLKIVWIDAHADLNTESSSKTKNTHGMPVASLLGHESFFGFPFIDPSQLIYIGLRDVDLYEQFIIDMYDIENYTSEEVHEYGIDSILDSIEDDCENIHISFDVDSLDPIHFQSTGTPVENGLTLDQVWNIFHRLEPYTRSIDFVEFNPMLTDKKTSYLESKLLGDYIKYFIEGGKN